VDDQYADSPSGGCVSILFIMIFFMMLGLWLMSESRLHRYKGPCPPAVDTSTCVELLGPVEDER
jgi:hypothetical protein